MTLEERNEVMKQKYYKSESTFKAVQHINRQKCRRYDHEFLKHWDKDYLG